MNKYRELIRNGSSIVDVTGMKKIIWGAGRNIRKFCAFLQLDDIGYVVDNNQEIIGKRIVLYGKEYFIQKPSVIKSLSPDSYIIMISTPAFRKEITNEIYREYNDSFIVCQKETQFIRGYTSVEDLFFYDPIINYKIGQGNISLCRDKLICRINRIIKDITDTQKIDLYYAIHEGIRLTFVAKIRNEKEYYFHIPTRKYREEYSPSDIKIVREAYDARMKVIPHDEIIVYLDQMGIEVTRSGEVQIDWNNKANIYELLNEIRKIHTCGMVVKAKRYPLWRIENKEKYVKEIGEYFPELLSKRIHEICDNELKNFTPKVCNGDLHADNIVKFQNKLHIIDWEWIGMSDPIWEIVYFIVSLNRFHKVKLDIEEILKFYYGRNLELFEIYHMKVEHLAIEYFIYLCMITKCSTKDGRMECLINQHIDSLLIDGLNN